MAGQRARSAAAAGITTPPTRSELALRRRAARMEAEIEAARSPLEQVAAAAASFRSLLKTATPDMSIRWAGEFVAFCRQAADAMTSANTVKETDGGHAAGTPRIRPADPSRDPQGRAGTDAAATPGRCPIAPGPGLGRLPAPAVGHG